MRVKSEIHMNAFTFKSSISEEGEKVTFVEHYFVAFKESLTACLERKKCWDLAGHSGDCCKL